MKRPFIENSKEVRIFLDNKNVEGLSFYQGKEFLYATDCLNGNGSGHWVTFYYATGNLNECIFEDSIDCRGNIDLFKEIMTQEFIKNER